jgi:hypothetical protein
MLCEDGPASFAQLVGKAFLIRALEQPGPERRVDTHCRVHDLSGADIDLGDIHSCILLVHLRWWWSRPNQAVMTSEVHFC